MGITKTKDVNNVPKLLKIIEQLENKKLNIGILSSADGQMLTIASVHEFGCVIEVTDKMRKYLHSQGLHLKKETKVIEIPERSFIRAGFDENKSNIENTVSKIIEKLLSFEIDVDTFMEFIGNYCTDRIKEYLVDLSSPPLSSYTVSKKGSSNPLVDTGHLRDSITFEIL